MTKRPDDRRAAVALLLSAALSLAACAHGPPPIAQPPAATPVAPAQPDAARVALDTALCAATDVLPGVAETVGELLRADVDAAYRAISGAVAAGGAVARGYACYLRSLAARRAASGEVAAAARPEPELIRNRAAGCPSGTCRPELAAATVLVRLAAAGHVFVEAAPTPLPAAPPTAPAASPSATPAPAPAVSAPPAR